MDKKAVLLAQGVAAVDANGKTFIMMLSGKSVGWWEYLYKNRDEIDSFIRRHGNEQQRLDFKLAVLTFAETAIVQCLNEVWEDAPDDVADAKHRDLRTYTAIERLIYDSKL